MSTDLERQIAGFAEALDREASAISFDDVIGRRTVAVDVEPPASDRATHVDSAPWLDATPGRDEVDHHDVLIELAPAVIVRGPESRRLAWKIALGAAAVAMLVVVLTAIQRGDDDPNPAVGLPELTTTFVSPRNGFSIRHPDGARVTPAMEDGEDGFDIVDVGSGTTFEGTSTENTDWHQALIDEQGRSITQDERIDEYLSADGILPGGCGVPRRQQAAITIDGRSGRIAECPHRIEATVVAGGRLYVFALSHDRRDARDVFDALAATIELSPETAVHFPAMTTTFVSPTYGYSFKVFDRGGLAPATERWDPEDQPVADRNLDGRFDGVETGLLAYFEGASTEIPDGVAIDAWVDEYVTPTTAGGCGVPRGEQAEVTIDGRPGRIAACDHSEVTVVAGGRLYLFTGPGTLDTMTASRNRAWFDAWIDTIDLTPETATVP